MTKERLLEHCGRNASYHCIARARIDIISTLKSRIINLIKYLKSIKTFSLGYDENQYEMATIIDAIRNLVNICQKEEDLRSYQTRFRNLRDTKLPREEVFLHKKSKGSKRDLGEDDDLSIPGASANSLDRCCLLCSNNINLSAINII